MVIIYMYCLFWFSTAFNFHTCKLWCHGLQLIFPSFHHNANPSATASPAMLHFNNLWILYKKIHFVSITLLFVFCFCFFIEKLTFAQHKLKSDCLENILTEKDSIYFLIIPTAEQYQYIKQCTTHFTYIMLSCFWASNVNTSIYCLEQLRLCLDWYKPSLP